MDTQKLFDLKGKTALVTGASKGLGFSLAQGLACHGAKIAMIARDQAALKEAKEKIEAESGSTCWTHTFDLHDTSKVDVFFSEVVRTAGPVDILVNCAGINKRGLAEDISPAVWQEVLQINLTATFAMSQAFCKSCCAS